MSDNSLKLRVIYGLVLALVTGTGFFLHARGQREQLPPRADLSQFPAKIGTWSGRDLPISPEIREVLGAGEFLQRVYIRPGDDLPVNLFIAYFPSQKTGSTIHSPKNCLPGSGWTPIESGHLELVAPGGRTITVNRYNIIRGFDRLLVLYWYQAHGRVVASEYWAKFYLVADSMRMHRSDGALVRIIVPVLDDDRRTHPQRTAVEFAGHILPMLDSYIPR